MEVLLFCRKGRYLLVYCDIAGTFGLSAKVDILTLSFYNFRGIVRIEQLYAWGNILSTGGTMASTLGKHNPLRYRSYVYDEETKLYYLQSRYYNPEICRFISADAFVSTGQGILGYNMFAYCGNNPVMRVDPAGNSWYDWLNTIAGLLNPISTLTAIGALAIAVAQGRTEDIIHDLNKGCLDPFNQAESVALEAKVLGFYKGSSVIPQGVIPDGGFSIFGTIWIGKNIKSIFTAQDLNHELGHSVQERILGPIGYAFFVAVPSATYNRTGDYRKELDPLRSKMYYSKIWERTADWLGGVKREDYFDFWYVENFIWW